ncbi:MAG: Dabb family protein [Dysgonomonas mossii]|uniref:Dabb family protein n=1 Tax=Dysgonomonas mossii TaxID=163665 RepID=UPI001E11F7EC|nr:Dabb family protein [Dysgonomonas mossii]MBS5796699.1 Dabb family protein [Dysgonomonas mossii]MBS7110007.1 Dabb family protein [Dysgonomonas mossii]
MKNLILLILLFLPLYACSDKSKQEKKEAESTNTNIRHVVVFNLKHEVDDPKTAQFLEEGKEILTAIPEVKNFQVLRQVSKKTNFNFCFYMEFADSTAYKTYNDNPEHVKFVKERWETEVSDFMEIDLENYK